MQPGHETGRETEPCSAPEWSPEWSVSLPAPPRAGPRHLCPAPCSLCPQILPGTGLVRPIAHTLMQMVSVAGDREHVSQRSAFWAKSRFHRGLTDISV